MTKQVISHRRPRRKRGDAWTSLGVLGVTAIALAVGSWLAPYVYRPPLPPIEPLKTAAVAPLKLPREAPKDIVTESGEAPAPMREARRPARRERPQPTATESPAAEYEILTEAELDAISQARH